MSARALSRDTLRALDARELRASFRASRATNLALEGKPVHAVLAAGEWKSAAVLAYANEDAFDRGAILTKTLEESDSEES